MTPSEVIGTDPDLLNAFCRLSATLPLFPDAFHMPLITSRAYCSATCSLSQLMHLLYFDYCLVIFVYVGVAPFKLLGTCSVRVNVTVTVSD